MKKLLIFFILVLLILVSVVTVLSLWNSQQKPFERGGFSSFDYDVKPADNPCPEGEKMTYYYDDVPPLDKEAGCQPITVDAGKVCIQNSDCIYNCIFSIDDLEKLGCESDECSHTGSNCPVSVSCQSIQGRCEATQGESNLTITQPGQILCSCVGI